MNRHQGSHFEDFLNEEGIADKVEIMAIKRVIAYRIEQAMQKENLSKAKMAEKMQTSRSSLDRLLDEKNTAVTLATLARAARALGKRLDVHLV